MLLEALAADVAAEPLPMPEHLDGGRWIADPVPLLVALAELRAHGAALPVLAATLHESVAEYGAGLAARVARAEGLGTVVLGGGVFQNARLLGSASRRLAARGLTVVTARQLPPNDGGISYGQAAVAAARLRREAGER
jgi:hydrogenase maturation protein HypF